MRANSNNLEAVLTSLRRASVEIADDAYTIQPSSRALSLAAVYARARKVCLRDGKAGSSRGLNNPTQVSRLGIGELPCLSQEL
jgi:hypothetical protein